MGKQKKEEVGVLTTTLKMSDRFALLGLLPQQAAYGTLKLVTGIQDQLMPEAGEFEKLPGYTVHDNGNTSWDAKKEKGRRFSFSGFALKLIVEKLTALDKEEKLTLSHVPLWQKFVEGEEKVEDPQE
jgi:hypothetical protein